MSAIIRHLLFFLFAILNISKCAYVRKLTYVSLFVERTFCLIRFSYSSYLFHPGFGENAPKMSPKKRITIISTNGIHSGDSTHTQDQSMYPVSLSTKNTTKSTLPNPIPPLLLFESAIFVSFQIPGRHLSKSSSFSTL